MVNLLLESVPRTPLCLPHEGCREMCIRDRCYTRIAPGVFGQDESLYDINKYDPEKAKELLSLIHI